MKKFMALYPELLVRDVDVSAHFYVDVLGFRVEFERPEHRFYFLTYGEAQLMLLEDNETTHSRTGALQYPRGQGVNFSNWTDRVTPLASSDAALPEPDCSVFDVIEPNRQFFAPLHDD